MDVAETAKVPIILVYCGGAIIFLVVYALFVGRQRYTLPRYDTRFFIRRALFAPTVTQGGFILLVSLLYHSPAETSVAVGLTLEIGIFFWMAFVLMLMYYFYRRYRAMPNLKRRLAHMSPAERSAELSQVPKETLRQMLAEREHSSPPAS